MTLLTRAVLLAVLALAGCSATQDPGDAKSPGPVETSPCPETDRPPTQDGDLELRDELLQMQEDDQAERNGQSPLNGDSARTERLAEIIDETGWPTADLVGDDGASAAWLIAQHSDQDTEFQKQVLALMREAVKTCQADTSELAYLEDRVAVNSGLPQVYGTQVRCDEDGAAEPATPITDEAGVDERRAAAGLEPLADYLAEFAEACQAES